MPTALPFARRTQARLSHGSAPAFAVSRAALGAAAIGLAACMEAICRDHTGAMLVLLLTGGLIALLSRGSGRGDAC